LKIKYGHIIEDELKYRWKATDGLNSCSFTGRVKGDICDSTNGFILEIIVKEKMSGGGIREEVVRCLFPRGFDFQKIKRNRIDINVGDMVFVSGKKRGDVIECRELEVLN
jgi:hypothetical protein